MRSQKDTQEAIKIFDKDQEEYVQRGAQFK